jgi:hypothetical protein
VNWILDADIRSFLPITVRFRIRLSSPARAIPSKAGRWR